MAGEKHHESPPGVPGGDGRTGGPQNGAAFRTRESRLDERLGEHAASVQLFRGTVAVFLVVTDHARKRGLPLDAASLVVDGGTQVKGHGRPAVQRILARHGITELLSREGGRTSMGSRYKMERYVDLLNALHAEGLSDLDAIEAFWIARVRELLARRRAAALEPETAPARRRSRLRLVLDKDRSLHSVFRELIRQAEDRDATGPRGAFIGPVLTHLATAALEWEQPSLVKHTKQFADDSSVLWSGRFELGEVQVWVAAYPRETLIAGLRESLGRGEHPILITLPNWAPIALSFAERVGIGERLEVFDIEHFLVTRLHLRSQFRTDNLRKVLRGLVSRYNQIVDLEETDPGLKIRFRHHEGVRGARSVGR